MGNVDLVGLRSGPLVLFRVWRPDESCVVHRTASGRRDQGDPQGAPERSDGRRFVAVAVTEGTTFG